mmetsp:Transcript_10214/g.24363  ORF Transcript_10214/g.24363 Transcript_10214/m.24363 type:complete len:245 (+) Transcript_10214:787-1521(+)
MPDLGDSPAPSTRARLCLPQTASAILASVELLDVVRVGSVSPGNDRPPARPAGLALSSSPGRQRFAGLVSLYGVDDGIGTRPRVVLPPGEVCGCHGVEGAPPREEGVVRPEVLLDHLPLGSEVGVVVCAGEHHEEVALQDHSQIAEPAAPQGAVPTAEPGVEPNEDRRPALHLLQEVARRSPHASRCHAAGLALRSHGAVGRHLRAHEPQLDSASWEHVPDLIPVGRVSEEALLCSLRRAQNPN